MSFAADYPLFKELYNWLIETFASIGVGKLFIHTLAVLVNLAIIAVFAWLTDLIGRKLLHSIIRKITARTSTEWDDILVKRKVFKRISNLLPAIVVVVLFSRMFADYPKWVHVVTVCVDIYFVIIIVLIINAIFNSINEIYQLYGISKNKPIKGYIQIVQILIYLFALVLIVSFLIGKNPLYLLTGLGAFMAILVLVFKDPIQGFVAGIQLSSNDMVRIDDWITMPKYGADGTVLEITLATVKVVNFDKTIVSIPTYAMVTESFQNWRGMQESDGRRIKRAIFLDMNSAQFADAKMLDHLRRFRLIREYIDTKQKEIEEHNSAEEGNEKNPAQYYGRRQTNFGIFRAYVEEYLKNHPGINTSMTLMVRQLSPTEKGIPLEVYAFSRTKEWTNYEILQSDIFDHIISIVPEFGLRIFQEPSGKDLIEGLTTTLQNKTTSI